MVSEVSHELSPNVQSSSEARSVALDWAQGRGEDLTFALELVVSELVTNAVRHGSGPIVLTLADTGGGVRVGVHDHGRRLPETRRPDSRSPGGRGLRMVERLSASWGVERSRAGHGKTVWAILATPGDR
jgi:anti-sigma regulatory factor (Ser/Thr protein kinase)